MKVVDGPSGVPPEGRRGRASNSTGIQLVFGRNSAGLRLEVPV